jgi:hypothetical protein
VRRRRTVGEVQATLRKIFCGELTRSGKAAYTELMTDFETTTPAGYITIEEAAETRTEQGTFWELHPQAPIMVTIYGDDGMVLDTLEVTSNAALTDLDVVNDDEYLVYGNENGDNFQGEALVDPWTPVRLVDAR